MENTQYDNEIQCALEAVLFASGESVHIDKLCAVLEVSAQEVHEAATALADFYDYNRRGIKIIRLENCYQMCSRGDYSEQVRHALESRRAPTLSQAALEVLAIVAYQQPATKVYVERVRGVDSSYTVRSLIDKGLIEECGKLDAPGRPTLFRTTDAFLRAFALSTVKSLPRLDETSEQLSFPLETEEP